MYQYLKKDQGLDNFQKVLKVLKKNLDLLNIEDCSETIKSDVSRYLKFVDKKFDIIFADPPYGEYDFFDLKKNISKFLKPNGIFCMEMKKEKLNDIEDNIRIKHYGNTQVVFWTLN